ncbi:MAG: hydroxymethylbilane synthase [Pseudomonadota bacterium]|nr:hydroxymethylbilane synthase [Pseudomonadota bacterium]
MTQPSTRTDTAQGDGLRQLRLASRASPLALAQTRQVMAALPDIACEIVSLSTTGDEVLDRPLVEVGGKGVFIKTLETALLDGRADMAVHSAKDMEAVFAAGTQIAAFMAREDMRDALVGPYRDIDSLPDGAVIGTASVRRTALLRHYRPDLDIRLLRGNINSRLARLEGGEFDAILLAVAGLKRLDMQIEYYPQEVSILPPAAAQGALAIQIATAHPHHDQLAACCARLNCADTADCVTAERAALAYLDGSCQTPIAALAEIRPDGRISLGLSVLSEDGAQKFDITDTADRQDTAQLGRSCAERLLAQCGGRDFLA